MITEFTRALIQRLKTVEPNTVLSPGAITELERIPAIVIVGPKAQEVLAMRSLDWLVVEQDDQARSCTLEQCPKFYNLVYTITAAADEKLDLLEMIEALSRMEQQAPVLSVVHAETGRTITRGIEWRVFPAFSGAPNFSEVCEAAGELWIRDVPVFSGLSKTVPYIRTVDLVAEPRREFENE